jgi:hypothetical protein
MEMEPLILFNLDSSLFEDILYDYFENEGIGFINYYIISESFWEPVTVSYKGVNTLCDIIGENNCYICTENHLNFKKLRCCKQKMCNDCCYKWFESSVKCPYCYQDIREFDLKKTTI